MIFLTLVLIWSWSHIHEKPWDVQYFDRQQSFTRVSQWKHFSKMRSPIEALGKAILTSKYEPPSLNHWPDIQSPRLFWARIMLKWANKYLGIQRLQSRSVYGDSNSFSMVVSGKKMNCQKVAPFLWNLPTFKKRTHQFWDSKVSGAFPGGLWAKVLLSKCLLQ